MECFSSDVEMEIEHGSLWEGKIGSLPLDLSDSSRLECNTKLKKIIFEIASINVKKLTWEQVFQDCVVFSQLLHQLHFLTSQ
jgi:hypothetical protein